MKSRILKIEIECFATLPKTDSNIFLNWERERGCFLIFFQNNMLRDVSYFNLMKHTFTGIIELYQ